MRSTAGRVTDRERARIALPGRARAAADFRSVEEGKVADLVLLSRHPVADIGGGCSIEAVVFDGILHDRAALDGLLEGVRAYVADDP